MFVDDTSCVLYTLKRMLRSLQETWEIVFMNSPVDALEAAKEKPFDVVVADLNMPEMNGAELLSCVTAMQPDTTGFILSGDDEYADRFSAVPTAYEFIPKPCTLDLVRRAIERALASSPRPACA